MAVAERGMVMGDAYEWVREKITDELDKQAGAASALAAATALCTATDAQRRDAAQRAERYREALEFAVSTEGADGCGEAVVSYIERAHGLAWPNEEGEAIADVVRRQLARVPLIRQALSDPDQPVPEQEGR